MKVIINERPASEIPLIELQDSIETMDQTLMNLNYQSAETDPTIPFHIKNITQEDILKWNQTPEIVEIPENVSAFNNDVGYLTLHLSLSGYATEQWVENKNYLTQHQDISNFINDAEYDSQNYRINFKHNNNIIAYIDATNFIKDGMVSNVEIKSVIIDNVSTQCLVISFNSDSGKLDINIPINQLFNISNYYTKTETDNTFVKSQNLHTVATSGSYNDLSDKPTIPDVQILSDWNQSDNTQKDYIKNKPTIPDTSNFILKSLTTGLVKNDGTIDTNTYLTQHQDISGKADIANLSSVAFSGNYSDLQNKPTIPVVPTNVSAFTNDAGYLTLHLDISGKVDMADLADVAVSGNYADLKNTPEIPTIPRNISAFVNNVGYLTQHLDISGKYDKTGGNISGDVDIDGTLKLNIEDEDYESAITMSASLDDNLGTILTLTGNADSTQYKTLLRNIATPNSNYDAANKKYVDDHILIPNYYLVELNIDGSVHLKASALTYSTVSANLTDPTKADYLDVFWENGAGTNLFTRFYAKAIEIVEVNSGDIKFIGDIEYAGILRRMVFTLNSNDVLTTTSITTSEIISNKKNSVVNNLSDDYYASTNAIYNEFLRKPVTIWETSGTGLLSSEQDIKENMTWQLTGLDMSPYKRVKIYTKAGKKTSGVGQDASNTPAVVLEMSLDTRAASPVGEHFLASTVGLKPNDSNRLFTVTCAVSSDKTKFVVLRMSSLYGTAATANSDVNGYVWKIEGYYD